MSRRELRGLAALLCTATLPLFGCWEQVDGGWWFPQMKRQIAVQAFEENPYKPTVDHLSPPEGTVPIDAGAPPLGKTVEAEADQLVNPRQPDLASLENGREQYDIFCSVCHGLTGQGGNGPTGHGLVGRRWPVVIPNFHYVEGKSETDNRVGGFGSLEDLVAGYREAGGGDIDPTRIHFWEVFGTLKWGIMCMLMVSAFRSGLDRSVERAAIGPLQVLDLNDGRASGRQLVDDIGPLSQHALRSGSQQPYGKALTPLVVDQRRHLRQPRWCRSLEQIDDRRPFSGRETRQAIDQREVGLGATALSETPAPNDIPVVGLVDPFDQFGQQPRFAHADVTGDEHHLAATRCGRPDDVVEHPELLPASEEIGKIHRSGVRDQLGPRLVDRCDEPVPTPVHRPHDSLVASVVAARPPHGLDA